MDNFPNKVSKLVQGRFCCPLTPAQSALDPSLHCSQCSPGHFSFFLFFLMWSLFKLFIEFVTKLLLFYVFGVFFGDCFIVFWLRGMWDLSSLTRDRTCTPCTGRRSLNHWIIREVPSPGHFYQSHGAPSFYYYCHSNQKRELTVFFS